MTPSRGMYEARARAAADARARRRQAAKEAKGLQRAHEKEFKELEKRCIGDYGTDQLRSHTQSLYKIRCSMS